MGRMAAGITGMHHAGLAAATFPAGAVRLSSEQWHADGLATLVAGAAVQEVITTDGVKLRLGPNHWLMLRFSGTEPLLRLNAEARSPEVMADLRDRVLAIVREGGQ